MNFNKYFKKSKEDILLLLNEKNNLKELQIKYPIGVQLGKYWNAIEWINDEPYRLRVDCLILDSNSNIYILKTTKKTKWVNPLKYYRVPGGSLEKNLNIKQVAIMECMEEAGFRFPEHDIIETGISYIVDINWKDDDIFKKIYKETGIKMAGGKTYIVICRYWGIRDNSYLENEDSEIYKNGNFYPISEVKNILRKEHLQALSSYFGYKFTDESINENIDEKLENIIGKNDYSVVFDPEDFKDIKDLNLTDDENLGINFHIDENTSQQEFFSQNIISDEKKQIKDYFFNIFGYNTDNFQIDILPYLKGRYNGKYSIYSFKLEQLIEGMLYEREHTDDIILRIKITLDHLTENEDYYYYLRKENLYPIVESISDIDINFADNIKKLNNKNYLTTNWIINSDYDLTESYRIVRNFLLNNFVNLDINNYKRTIFNGVEDIIKVQFEWFNTPKLLNELKLGIEIEKEHFANDIYKCLEIALDHLVVFPTYYTTLLKIEKNFIKKSDKIKFLSESVQNDLNQIFGIEEQMKIVNFQKLYNEILKDKIEIGHLYIYFTNSAGILAKAITKVTKDPYNHTGICFDKNLETMISFDIKGGGLVYQHPLVSFNRNTTFELYRINITKKDLAKIIDFLDKLSKSNSYNFTTIFKSNLMGYESEIMDKNGKFKFTCATFTYFILNLINVEFNFKDDLNISKITPYDIFKYMKKKSVKFIADGNLYAYYYKVFGIDDDNTKIWKYGFKTMRQNIKNATLANSNNSLLILNNRIELQPIFEETLNEDIIDKKNSFNKLYNKADLSDHKGVGGIVRNSKNEILILFHNKYNAWSLPMGKVDNGNSIDYTLKKELKEEINIDVQNAQPIINYVKQYLRNGILVKVDFTIFDVIKYTGIPKNLEPKKHKKMIWMKYDDIIKLDNITDSIKAIINYYGGSTKYYNLNEETVDFDSNIINNKQNLNLLKNKEDHPSTIVISYYLDFSKDPIFSKYIKTQCNAIKNKKKYKDLFFDPIDNIHLFTIYDKYDSVLDEINEKINKLNKLIESDEYLANIEKSFIGKIGVLKNEIKQVSFNENEEKKNYVYGYIEIFSNYYDRLKKLLIDKYPFHVINDIFVYIYRYYIDSEDLYKEDQFFFENELTGKNILLGDLIKVKIELF